MHNRLQNYKSNTMAENKTRFANRYGQLYDFEKEKITSLSELCPGDHIAVERFKLFWHHMIVENIDHNAKKINVIHYCNTMKEFFKTSPPYKAIVRRDEIEFTPSKLFRILYEDEKCNPAKKVLEEARARIGEKKYNCFRNNCEHFCTECKINEAESQQVHILRDVLLNNVNTAVIEIFLLLLEGSESVLFAGVPVPGMISCAVVTICFAVRQGAVDIYKAYEKYRTKRISFGQFWKLVARIVVVVLSTEALTIVGFVLGQVFIPVPLVGGMVGSILGHYSGMLLSVIVIQLCKTAIQLCKTAIRHACTFGLEMREKRISSMVEFYDEMYILLE